MNQPPPTETQTGKRIVSKGKYVKAKSMAALLSIGVLACGIGIFILLFFINYLWGFENDHDSPADYYYAFHYFWGSVTLFLPLVLITYLLGRAGVKSLKAVQHMQPLTRANTADLPAPDSLVRASAEPIKEQQAVLLRAAVEGQEKHKEQLVRAAGGGE